jgi:hypothetical protein
MDQKQFARAPIVRGADLAGYVVREELSDPDSSIDSAVRLIGPSVVVSGDTAVGRLLRWLCQTPFMFVLEGNTITGFVTVADVNKQPGRTYFFLLLAEFELMMAETIRRNLDDDAVLQLLPEERRTRLLVPVERDRSNDISPDVVSYLNFSDLMNVIGKTPELMATFQIRSRHKWEDQTGSLEGLRNKVMHPTRPLVENEPSLSTLVQLDDRLQALLTARLAGGFSIIRR